MRRMWLVRDPWHRAGPWTRIWWKLLGSGSTWSSRHPTSHTAGHTTGDSTWDVPLHTGRHPPGHGTGNIPNWRTTRGTGQNLLTNFLSSDIRPQEGLQVGEGYERVGWLRAGFTAIIWWSYDAGTNRE
jgi:hypothetical protein